MGEKEYTSVDEKINEIVEEWHSCDEIGCCLDCEKCDCKVEFRKDLMELVTLVQKNSKK